MTLTTIMNIVQIFNKRANGKGFDFRVASLEDNLYIQGSAAFTHYINVHLMFNNILFTNLKTNERWTDAYMQDQLFMMNHEELRVLLTINKIDLNHHEAIFGFIFNVNGIGRSHMNSTGIIICKGIEFKWQHPEYEVNC